MPQEQIIQYIHSLIHEAAFALEEGRFEDVKKLHQEIDQLTHCD